MDFLPSRKSRTRYENVKRRKISLPIFFNFLIFHLILLVFSTITADTYSYFMESAEFSTSIKNLDEFCKSDEYFKSHVDMCKKQQTTIKTDTELVKKFTPKKIETPILEEATGNQLKEDAGEESSSQAEESATIAEEVETSSENN